MKKFIVLLALVSVVFAGREGLVGAGKAGSDESLASMADVYTVKKIKMSGASGNLVVSTTYPGLILKGYYNPRQDSSVVVKFRTAAGDTAVVSVPAESSTFKMPVMDIVFKTGTGDSVFGIFQKR